MINIIKKYIRILFVITTFLSSQTFGIDVMNIPPLNNFVVDYTNSLTSSQIKSFASGAYQIQQQTSAQIATLIIPDRDGRELYDIALDVFRTAGLWDKNLNNGLLLIIAKDEKKLRLTVWYGLEWNIPDVLAREMVEQIRPYVDSGDIYGAIQTYYDLVMPYVQWTGKARSEESNLWYQVTIWDQIRGILFFLSMSSALWSKHLKKISLSKNKQKSLSTNIISIGTVWLIVIAIISFSLISFGFFWWLLWYIFWLITGNGQWFTMSSWRGRGYYGWGGFTGWWWSSRWWGGGWFSWWFGGSSGWGGAGD